MFSELPLFLFVPLHVCSCSFLFTYWQGCGAVLPKPLKTAWNLCFFFHLSLWGYLRHSLICPVFICVCSPLCVICWVVCVCVCRQAKQGPHSYPLLGVSERCLSHPDKNPSRKKEDVGMEEWREMEMRKRKEKHLKQQKGNTCKSGKRGGLSNHFVIIAYL